MEFRESAHPPLEAEIGDEAEQDPQMKNDLAVLERVIKVRTPWDKLSGMQKGALWRLAARAEELDEGKQAFLQEIGAGTVPEKGLKDYVAYHNALRGTLISGDEAVGAAREEIFRGKKS